MFVFSLQFSWIKSLFDNNFYQLKVIPLYLIRWYFEANFKFHSNLEINPSVLRNFAKFYQELFFRCGKYLSFLVTLPSTVVSQFIWLTNI